jgi:hypothetical protein
MLVPCYEKSESYHVSTSNVLALLLLSSRLKTQLALGNAESARHQGFFTLRPAPKKRGSGKAGLLGAGGGRGAEQRGDGTVASLGWREMEIRPRKGAQAR